MMSRIPFIAAVAALLLVGACASPTPYRPAENGRGFQEVQIEPGRYRVQFAGNSVTTRETVENYTLYRAAELTVAAGGSHFMIVDDDTEVERFFRTTVRSGRFGRRILFDRRGFCCGPGPVIETTRPIERYTAIAEIRAVDGEALEDDVNVYDAHQVLANLGPLIIRGGETETADATKGE